MGMGFAGRRIGALEIIFAESELCPVFTFSKINISLPMPLVFREALSYPIFEAQQQIINHMKPESNYD